MTSRLPTPSDQHERPGAERGETGELGELHAAVRWTLGNLEQAFEQAFDQALDEAFRTCTTILDELGPVSGEGGVRFGSCDGPVADGELGEGSGTAAC